MTQLTQFTSGQFIAWLQAARRPHVGLLRGDLFTIDSAWDADLRTHGGLLHSIWSEHGGKRLVWTEEGCATELIRRSGTPGWEWVRSTATAWRVRHSAKGAAMPDSIAEALADVLSDIPAARYALEATRLEAILAASTARGIRVDLKALQHTHADMQRIQKQLRDTLGFDPLLEDNAAPTLAWLSQHGIDVPSIHSDDWGARTTSGQPLATEAERVYEQVLYLRRRFPKVRELVAQVKRSTLHSRFEPFAQVSGRISSTRPALNNIAADLRHLLVARPGHALVTADFDGIEPRILAALSGDSILAEHLASGDPYADAAERAGFGRTTHRRAFKVVMISTMYGAGVGRTARQLGVSLEEARRVRAALWQPYPRAQAWLREESGLQGATLDSGRPLGVVERPYARPNLLIQSTAYDVFQGAALRVHDCLPAHSHIWMPLHDELILETPHRSVEAVKEVLGSLMPTEFRGVQITALPVELGPAWKKI
ncbi:DNA polymerase [Microbacterium sp. zg-YB36]|uniref:DNA polymerase n=1 Tax=Microbacterium sp. zg-YB36 TaxID=2969407 RepID=UPI00214B2ED1|nr:DNA polymerase [Microbacterium sp. zg-YB36]MDL5352164.1 DNA polymerase [Microbacterium sp. zg-YB36]